MNIEMLINKDNLLASDFVPEDLFITDDNKNNFHMYQNSNLKPQISAKVIPYLIWMKEDMKKSDLDFIVDSGYRSFNYQQVIWDYNLKIYGLEETKISVAVPGSSEHQSGLAFDIAYVKNNKYIDNIKEDDEEVKWLKNNAFKYGFILRYPKGKEKITKFKYEPWHYRFVGIPLATLLHRHSLTLEEYYQNKELYYTELNMIENPKIITTVELLANVLLIHKSIHINDLHAFIKIFKYYIHNCIYIESSLSYIRNYIDIKNNVIFLKEDLTKNDLQQLMLLSTKDIVDNIDIKLILNKK